jgi:hypothetical protein
VQVKISQAVSMITTILKCKLVPMLIGSPGCGKSSVAYMLAEIYNLKLIDLRLSQCDPTDLLGFPQIFGKKAGYVPMETFPLEGDPIPDGYSGWLLFLDELTTAGPAVQAAGYKLILDRMVGQHKLHPKVAIMGAGNKETDNAIVQPMSTALQSRMIHLELVVDHEEFIDWASTQGFNHFITDYIGFMPNQLFTFQPDHTDTTYACPRTWEFANRMLKAVPIDSPDLTALLSGALSEGVARQFLNYCKVYKSLPTLRQIKLDPEHTPVPEDKGMLYALTGSISSSVTNDASFAEVVKYVKRFPVEFQVVTLKDTVRRNAPMKKNEAFQEWLASSALTLF